MSNKDIQALAAAWKTVTAELTAKMWRFEAWPSAKLRQSRIEGTRGEIDSIFAHLDSIRSAEPSLPGVVA